jgi:hypothetical protein
MIDNQKLLDTLAANSGNVSATAKELGVSRSTLRNRIGTLALRGETGVPELGKIYPGMRAGLITSHVKTIDGKPEVVQEWIRQKPDLINVEEFIEMLEDRFADLPPIAEIPLLTAEQMSDLMTVYPIIDHHLGLYSWEAETGANFDLKIAAQIFRTSFAELFARTPASKLAILLNIGDFFHSDDDSNRTRRSGNQLDVDGRSAKILELGVDLVVEAIELALTKHECVEYRGLRGNHDPDLSIALNIALRQAFKNNPRVHISRDPGPFYFKQFGKVLIGATHGDMVKADDTPAIMAAYAPKAWGSTEHRYVYLGHVHHRSKGGGEKFGAEWETFRTLTAKDAWSTQSGYASGRSMVAITHHRDTGEKYRDTVTISGPGYKKGL